MKLLITCNSCNTSRRIIRHKKTKLNQKFWCEKCLKMVEPIEHLTEIIKK